MGGHGVDGVGVGHDSEQASVLSGSGIRMLQSLQNVIFGNPLSAVAFPDFQNFFFRNSQNFYDFFQKCFEKLASELIPDSFVRPM